MSKTDVFIHDTTDRTYLRSRTFRLMLHDLQRAAEKYGVDFVLFVEDQDETAPTGDETVRSSMKFFSALGTCPGMEDETALAEMGL